MKELHEASECYISRQSKVDTSRQRDHVVTRSITIQTQALHLYAGSFDPSLRIILSGWKWQEVHG
jgi:hypothetical protein